MKPPITQEGQGDLFPEDNGPGKDATPDALKAAAELVRMACTRISCLWEWRTLPLAPELAALVAQPRPSHGHD